MVRSTSSMINYGHGGRLCASPILYHYVACLFSLFFFQAEDGIRDIGVTGVQTCALPISLPAALADRHRQSHGDETPGAPQRTHQRHFFEQRLRADPGTCVVRRTGHENTLIDRKSVV